MVDVAVGVVRNKQGRVLISRRKDGAHQGGLWEFPGGKLESGENSEMALNRELYEELNISSQSSCPLIDINFNYPDCHVRLHVREVDQFDGEAIGREGQLFQWVEVKELSKYAFPEANKPILTAIGIGRQYAIVGGNSAQQIMLELENMVKQGVSLVQIRAKELCKQDSEYVMSLVRRKCIELNLSYLVNSQMLVKRNSDEGVHLTSSDLMDSIRRPESNGLVAASCHSLEELQKAEALSLDFAVLSPIKETNSHPSSNLLGWQQFAEWVGMVNIPVFALGGLGKQDYLQAISSGAQGISGIGLFKRAEGK